MATDSRAVQRRRGRNRTLLFAATIALSAFMLFALELYAGRMVLPAFGGTPSVWTTALCFFSAVVFVGYALAHLAGTRLGRTAGGALHVALAVTTVAAAVFSPTLAEVTRHARVPAAFDVLWALAAIAGAPALLMATTTPLLSWWYSEDGSSPWWLYATSNAASLAGLLAYPILIEPNAPLSSQRMALSTGLIVLAGLLTAIVIHRLRAPAAAATAYRAASGRGLPGTLQWWWVFAAAIPSGLLAATTTHLATDHVSAPLLWVGPLSVYLGSFAIAFSRFGPRMTGIANRLLPTASTCLWIPYVARISWPPLVVIPLMLWAYGVLAMALHGELAARRPDEAHLTRFYLLVSAGGLLATAFVAVAAPLVFSGVYEFPLLLVAGLLVLAAAPKRDIGPLHSGTHTGASESARTAARPLLRETAARLTPYLVAITLILIAVSRSSVEAFALVVLVVAIGFQVVALGRSPRSLALATTLALAALMLILTPQHELRVRTFFGVTEVRRTGDGEGRQEIHGTTLHGLQFSDERRLEPTSYFVRSGPLGDIFGEFHRREPDGGSIGVVGLGIGTMAAYARDTDQLTFFEVDPAVARIAEDSSHFTYLRDAASTPRVVIGDGRLSLGRIAPASFDVLLLDAFTSDAVPAHLLTREALRTYKAVLRPNGLIVFQLTNRHFDLAPAVASTARSLGLAALSRRYEPPASERELLAAQPSQWLVVGRARDLDVFAAAGWTRPAEGVVLTDDYSDVLRLLRMGQ